MGIEARNPSLMGGEILLRRIESLSMRPSELSPNGSEKMLS